MPSISPTVEGFRWAFRRPSLTFAEMAWRWSVGAVAVAAAGFFLIEYLGSLPVSNPDLLLLSSGRPALVARALKDVFHGSMNRAVLAAGLVILALSFLWIMVASFGRMATVRALIEVVRGEIPGEVSASLNSQPLNPHPMSAMIELNCLRAVMFLAAFLAIVGSVIASGFVSTAAKPHPGLALMLFLAFFASIGCVAWSLNWWLSLAQIFSVRSHQSAIASVSEAVAMVWERPGRFAAVSFWTGMAHLVSLSIAGTAISFPLILAGLAPRSAIAGVIFVLLVYLAVVDWLSTARLGGYVLIAEMPEALFAKPPVVPSASPSGNAFYAATIDRDESILSDLPGSALES